MTNAQHASARISLILAAALVAAVVPRAAAAQEATARITGTVLDTAGEPVADVTVKLQPDDPAELSFDTTTNKKGRFTFPQVSAVTYVPAIASSGWVLERVEVDLRAPDGSPVASYEEGEVRKNGPPKIGVLAMSRIDMDLVVSEVEAARAAEPGQAGIASVAGASGEVDVLNALFELGKWDDLVTRGQASVAATPDEGGAHYLLAIGLWKLGRHDEAAEHFGRALELVPDQAGIHGVVGSQLIEHARERQQVGDEAGARALYERAASELELQLAATPDARTHLVNLVIAAEGAGRTEKAVEVLRDLVRVDPADAQARLRLAELLVEIEEPGEAIELLAGLPGDAKKTAELIYNAAVTIWNAGDMDATIAAVERAIALEPDNPEFHRLKGRAHISKGDNAAAIAALEKAVELDPDAPAAATDRALIERLRMSEGG